MNSNMRRRIQLTVFFKSKSPTNPFCSFYPSVNTGLQIQQIFQDHGNIISLLWFVINCVSCEINSIEEDSTSPLKNVQPCLQSVALCIGTGVVD